MRPRPHPDRRRGLLRASLAVIVLLALLIVGIGIAGAVHQPTTPAAPTPPPTVNLKPPTTQPTPKGSTTATPEPKAHPAPTAGKTPKTAALAPGQGSLFEKTPRVPGWPTGAVVGAQDVAYFEGHRGAYAPSPLVVVSRRSGKLSRIGSGDRLVRPAWSRDGRYLLYVRVAPTKRSPGALWTIMQTDVRTGRTIRVWSQPALAVQPLGRHHGQILYAAAENTDTAVYAVRGRNRAILGTMMSEPITNPVLSPDGRYVAFATPTNCGFCTVNIYDLSNQWNWSGPAGMPHETDLAWGSHDLLVASLGKKMLIATANGFHPSVKSAPLPPGLPRIWYDPMQATQVDRKIIVVDSDTRHRYVVP